MGVSVRMRPRLISRAERVESRRGEIYAPYEEKQQAFLEFVLGEYVRVGVEELDLSKLAGLLQLKYGNVNDAIEQLGEIPLIRETFVGFQRELYLREEMKW